MQIRDFVSKIFLNYGLYERTLKSYLIQTFRFAKRKTKWSYILVFASFGDRKLQMINVYLWILINKKREKNILFCVAKNKYENNIIFILWVLYKRVKKSKRAKNKTRLISRIDNLKKRNDGLKKREKAIKKNNEKNQ